MCLLFEHERRPNEKSVVLDAPFVNRYLRRVPGKTLFVRTSFVHVHPEEDRRLPILVIYIPNRIYSVGIRREFMLAFRLTCVYVNSFPKYREEHQFRLESLRHGILYSSDPKRPPNLYTKDGSTKGETQSR